MIAKGITAAALELNLKIPLVVRLQGEHLIMVYFSIQDMLLQCGVGCIKVWGICNIEWSHYNVEGHISTSTCM